MRSKGKVSYDEASDGSQTTTDIYFHQPNDNKSLGEKQADVSKKAKQERSEVQVA